MKLARFVLVPMPPARKRMRTAGAVAQNIAAGSDTQVLLSTASDTPKLQRDCLSILESVYQLRHFKASDVHSSDCGLLKVESGLYPWPILWGGTFKEIAQRCWESPDRVIEESAALAARVGLLDAKDPDEFVREFCKVDASQLCFGHFVLFSPFLCNDCCCPTRSSLGVFILMQESSQTH